MPIRNNQSSFALEVVSKDAVCTAKQAGDLLEDLRRRYQRLTPAERNQMKLFISGLAESGIVMRNKSAVMTTNVFKVNRSC